MRYSTEWIVLIFVALVTLAVGYQTYQAGHLWGLGPSALVGVLFVAWLNRLERPATRELPPKQ